jgi:hypothetical protein
MPDTHFCAEHPGLASSENVDEITLLAIIAAGGSDR